MLVAGKGMYRGMTKKEQQTLKRDETEELRQGLEAQGVSIDEAKARGMIDQDQAAEMRQQEEKKKKGGANRAHVACARAARAALPCAFGLHMRASVPPFLPPC